MAHDEQLAARVRKLLDERDDMTERNMFGGIAFMLGGHMCCGVIGDDLVLRLGDEAGEEALADPHVRPMDFTGRPMRGFVYVSPEGTGTAAALRRWIARAAGYVATLPAKKA